MPTMADNMRDKAKDVASDLADKAQDAIERNRDRIDGAIDKAEDLADRATGGRLSDQIGRATDTARERLDDVSAEDGPPSKRNP